jgi:hypothetical protein
LEAPLILGQRWNLSGKEGKIILDRLFISDFLNQLSMLFESSDWLKPLRKSQILL